MASWIQSGWSIYISCAKLVHPRRFPRRAPANGGLLLALASSCGDIVLLKLQESQEDELSVCKVIF